MPEISTRASYRFIAAFTLLLLGVFIMLDRAAPGGRGIVKIRGVDSVNYFGITHSLLFDHDFNLTDEFVRVPPDGREWTAVQKASGLPGSPWGVGYSIVELPFLAAGTALDKVAGNAADGYSRWALYIYSTANIFVTGLGLAVLFALLRQVGEFWSIPERQLNLFGLFVTLATFFGTNVGYYAFPHIAHAATFLFVSLFLYVWWRVRESDAARSWFMLGLIGGFLSICRWQDILYLGGPVFYDVLQRKPWREPRRWFRARLGYAAGAGLCWVPQIAEWKIIYGKYLTLPQGDGFLHFPPAHIAEVLFSSRNGWFLWTPLTMVGVAGLVYGATRAKRVFLPWIAVLVLEVTVIGCMKTWHGFDSFSARYLLANSSIVAVGLLTLLAVANPAWQRVLVAITIVCCIFTSLFAVQYRLDLIPTNETLTSTELFRDKLNLVAVKQRKTGVRRAQELLSTGDSAAAIQILEPVANTGDDRQVLAVLANAYKAAGQPAAAERTTSRLNELLAARLP